MSVIEVARIRIRQGGGADFEAVVADAELLFRNAPGCLGMRLDRSIEEPLDYRLIVTWRTVDDHMVRFRSSSAYAKWRALAAPFFAAPPEVEHVRTVVAGF